jgi:hypothetical protein
MVIKGSRRRGWMLGKGVQERAVNMGEVNGWESEGARMESRDKVEWEQEIARSKRRVGGSGEEV